MADREECLDGGDLVELRPARQSERDEALRVLFGRPADADGAARARGRSAIAVADQTEVDLSGLFVAAQAGQVLAACLAVVSPGRAAIVVRPRGSVDATMAGRLLAACVDWAVSRGAAFCLSIIEPEDRHSAGLLQAQGFEFLARIAYMERPVARAVPDLALARIGRWETWRPDNEALFGQVIERTYEGSMDCPRLNGLRPIEDILASHKAEGVFNPDTWFLAYEADQPAGCLLLNRMPDKDVLELVYMGVTPPCRGRGLGRELAVKALTTARQVGVGKVTLAVDEHNGPAWRLYRSLGFKVVMSRAAYGKVVRK